MCKIFNIKALFFAMLCLITISAYTQTSKMTVKEKKAEAKIDALMSKMTLEEKVLQLLSYQPNGVPRLGIPNLQAGEALHGVVSKGTTNFPQSVALAATWDPELIEKMGVIIGQEARAVGIHQVFAPMLGLARDPRWGRIEESYGEDPWLASQIGVAYINGIQGKGNERFGPEKIIATPKHFLADGEPWGGHNGAYFEMSERILREIYMPPFEAAIKQAHAGSIMPAHHQLNGVPCHANSWLLDDVLRKEWGFDGYITSDMGDIPKLSARHLYGINGEKDATLLALKAGVDMELIGSSYKGLVNAVKEGKIPKELVDRSVRRVLKLKIQLLGIVPANSLITGATSSETSQTIQKYKKTDDIWAKLIEEGKFSTPDGARSPNAKEILSDPTHDELALKLAQKSIVLLKNENNLLPLDKSKIKKILVVGPLAKMPNTGGYSGGGSKPYINVVDGLKSEAGLSVEVAYEQGCNLEDANEELLAKSLAQAQSSDIIIAVVGHSRKQVGENLDRDNLDLIGGQQKLVEAMYASGKPVVVVLENGAPISIGWIKDKIPAIVESWYGGQNAGKAIAQSLFGIINPGGKMPLSVPKNLGQIPCYYNYLPITGPSDYYQSKWKNLFVFGEGLSYTTFRYSDLKIEPRNITPDQIATVTVKVENTGQCEGDDVVQLYIRQDFTSLVRPVKELKGFKRITLKVGEQQTVSFTLGFEHLKFWKAQRWVIEPGEIKIMIGSSSEDIRQNGILKLNDK